ncbi:MAG: tRNA preQ1(34) S-adenosylmethionine ribosyltransferase-isomerase QueA [Myxococcales bacterium]|nr:tRNA preQ1(34) S-adenosylmethionine ribosyltransferase-isomerase QueA [Myxococcales bacterium]
MHLDSLDYVLPPELVAQQPLAERDGARLLVLDAVSGGVSHRRVRDLPSLLSPSLLVLNDTKVIPARLFGKKPTGGRVELLLVEPLVGGPSPDGHPNDSATTARWLAKGRASKGLAPGTQVQLAPDFHAEVIAVREGGMVEVELRAEGGVAQAIGQAGHIPLPPYIRRGAEAFDRDRYQTVFADKEGAIAAPTAGLHLTHELLGALLAAGHRIAKVTLHVGPGTFAPIKAETLGEHPMHEERYEVPEQTAQALRDAKGDGMPVVAVGTTVVRTLEAAAGEDGEITAGPGSTRLCIYPPYRFRVVDGLFTNFHLPRSTLLALVMALGGEGAVRCAYAEAVRERYRFFSYGDAMLIPPRV